MAEIAEVLPVLVLRRCSIREVDHLRLSSVETIFEKPDKIPLEEMHRNGVVLHAVGDDDIADVFQCVITPIITRMDGLWPVRYSSGIPGQHLVAQRHSFQRSPAGQETLQFADCL